MAWALKRKRDTGWQTLPVLEGVDADGVWIKRHGIWVELEMRDVSTDASGHLHVAEIPAGYRPTILSANSTRSGVVVTDAGATRVASYYGSVMRILSADAVAAYSGHLIWSTTDPMPTGGA